VTAAAALISPPAQATDSELYANVAGWSIFKNSDDCSLVGSFDRSTSLYIAYTVGTNNVTVIIDDPAFKSVKDDQKYPVSIYLKKKGRLDDGWGDMDAVGLVTENMSAITLSFQARDFLDDFKASDTFAIMRDESKVVVENFDLKDSAAAIAKLEQCSVEVHRQNPADPFSAR
jgi:hypothetical protein